MFSRLAAHAAGMAAFLSPSASSGLPTAKKWAASRTLRLRPTKSWEETRAAGMETR